jgi:hypothetical protein
MLVLRAFCAKKAANFVFSGLVLAKIALLA